MILDTINIKELTSGYGERMRRLALLDPLVELERKRLTDHNGKSIDMRGLGMLVLLFFFERRLSREYKTGKQHVARFLQQMTTEIYQLDYKKCYTIADEIVTTFRPSTGRRRAFSFFNWEKYFEDQLEYTILKDNDFDVKTNTQYYTLAEDGLELLFATKEFYSEFQISINQLLLRQQIKKGEFHQALRQIREMEIDVDTLKERMEKMKLEILRSIVSEETFERYKKLLDDTHLRLEREDEEFKALSTFIKETRDTLYTGNTKKQEERSYSLLIKIAKELEAVHYEHARLIELTTDLRNTALATAQESLYYTGIQTFNFDQDIVLPILAKPHEPEIMKGLLHPFFKVEQNIRWSPLAIFDEQPIYEEEESIDDGAFIEMMDEREQLSYQKWIAEKYTHLFQLFLTAYEEYNIQTLKKFMEFLQDKEPSLLSKRYFYSFWLLLHQQSPIFYEEFNEERELTTLRDVFKLLGDKRLTVTEKPDIIQFDEKYSIQNMTIHIGENDDELS